MPGPRPGGCTATGVPALVVVSVDGGVPDVIEQGGFFDLAPSLQGYHSSPVWRVRSVYPSSTATAHASLLTGVPASGHGIVGNRFWEDEPVDSIRTRAGNPVASLHPYESGSLRRRPVTAEWLAQGHDVCAVQFPHTFSRPDRPESSQVAAFPSTYCLYAPARRIEVDAVAAGAPAGYTFTLQYFDQPLVGCIRMARGRASDTSAAPAMLSVGSVTIPLAIGNSWSRVDSSLGDDDLSVPVRVVADGRRGPVLEFGTAVLTFRFGGVPRTLTTGDGGPSSLHTSYGVAAQAGIHESPRAEWVARTALAMVDRYAPDVLLVRFNQTDHAQEYLHHAATKQSGKASRMAQAELLDTYRDVDKWVKFLAEELGSGPVFALASDHGIDYVNHHLRPNTVVEDLGLSDCMVFQGDSNCAFLYSDDPLDRKTTGRLMTALEALGHGVRRIVPEEARSLGLDLDDVRTGRLVITADEHTEFYYDRGEPVEEVASASHGFDPRSPAMDAFFRVCSKPDVTVSRVSVLTQIATTLRGIGTHVLGTEGNQG